MDSIETILRENRELPPSESFRRAANHSDPQAFEKLWQDAQKDPVAFWEKAAEEVHWFERWKAPLEWTPPFARWFTGGKTNAAYNCLDRHLEAGRGDKLALVWEAEDGSVE